VSALVDIVDEELDIAGTGVVRQGMHKTPQATALEAQGYEPWAMRLGRRTFKSPFSPFHHRFWRWYWPARMKLLRGEKLTADELTALLIWGRGLGKSSHVEWACIAEGALGEGVTEEPGFVGYVCADSDLAKGHLQSIRNRLLSPEVTHYYPGLGNPRLDAHGHQLGFRQDFLATDSGWGIVPLGLKEGVRGGRLLDLRYTMFVFDDVDNRRYSPDVIRKNLEIIAYEILPAGTPQTLKLFPQNLVRDDGVLAQILNRESDVLSRRTVIGNDRGEPQPAFDDVELEPDEERPGSYRIKSATPVWEGFDVNAAEVFLSDSGKSGFMAEFQHDLTGEKSEFVLQNWRDEVHVITESHFEARYGTRSVPYYWPKRGFNDWAKTNTAKHANVAGFLTVSPQMRDARTSGLVFLYDCMSFEANTGADEVALRIIKTLSPFAKVGGVTKTWEEVLSDAHSRENMGDYRNLTDLVERARDARSKVVPALVRPIVRHQKVTFRGSHDENNGALKVYRDVYGLDFSPVNPGADGGVELLNSLMLVDRTRPHLFKPDERGEDGRYKLGFSRFYLIVKDEKAAPPPANARPRDLRDSDRARYQLRKWRELPVKDNETGEVERGPEKRNDDFGNGLMMCVHDGLPIAPRLSGDEKFEVENPMMSREKIAEDIATGARTPNAWHAREVARREDEDRRRGGGFSSGIAARRYGKR
jgi:hypothetical protein